MIGDNHCTGCLYQMSDCQCKTRTYIAAVWNLEWPKALVSFFFPSRFEFWTKRRACAAKPHLECPILLKLWMPEHTHVICYGSICCYLRGIIMDTLKDRMPHNFCYLTPQKCSRFFFATSLSKNEETWKDINKNLQKLKKQMCSRVFCFAFLYVHKHRNSPHSIFLIYLHV